jgi:hypothetical protein
VPAEDAVYDAPTPAHSDGFAVQFLCFLLAATASALLLAATNLLCQEVTSVPLFWVLPLSIYLLSFILCFESSRWYVRGLFHPVFALSVVAICIAMDFNDFKAQAVAITVTLFCAWMICHGELARLKPTVNKLTSFYLTISLGGAVDGIFVAVVAPVVFNSFVEFQICLAAIVVLGIVCLLRDAESWIFDHRFVLPLAICSGTLLAAYSSRFWIGDLQPFLLRIRFYPILLLIGLISVIGTFVTGRSGERRKPGFRFVQLLVGFAVVLLFDMLYGATVSSVKLVTSRRNFYGVIQVLRSTNAMILMHGRTLHGAQFSPPYDRIPLTYYGPDSGIGVVLTQHPKRTAGSSSIRLGVVGLGVGTLATYGHKGDYIRYYELDPAVVELSRGQQPMFTFLRDSHANVDVAVGDARLLLESELAQDKHQRFGILVLDAFSGDAVPVHLLTKEAFDTYWQQIDPESGIIAVHISSRHVNLLPVVLGLAGYYKVPLVISDQIAKDPFLPSKWVLLARHPETLAIEGLGQVILPGKIPSDTQLWTDDRSDVFRLLR